MDGHAKTFFCGLRESIENIINYNKFFVLNRAMVCYKVLPRSCKKRGK